MSSAAEDLGSVQEVDMAEMDRLNEWFDALKKRYRPLWEKQLAKAITEPDADESVTRKDAAKNIANFAKEEYTSINGEINSMLVRTSIIVAAASLLLAAVTFKYSPGVAGVFLAIGLAAVGFAFVKGIGPTAPPFKRSREPYEPAHYWSLLVFNDFTRYVMYGYLKDRRAPVVQRYKRAHAWAVRALKVSTWMVVLAIMWTVILNLFQIH